MVTEAKRLPDSVGGEFPDGFSTGAICYWLRHDGVGYGVGTRWMLYLPGGGLGDLSGHEVTEHEDGTITVSPSILLTSGRKDRRRHGYLKRGVWQPCGDDVAPPDVEG